VYQKIVSCFAGQRLRERTARLLRCSEDSWPALETVHLGVFDPAQAPRESFDEEDLIVQPIVRQGVPAAYLLGLQVAGAPEGATRLLYSAVNLLSLHLTRILDTREQEADRECSRALRCLLGA